MRIIGHVIDKNFRVAKIAVGGAVIVGLGVAHVLWRLRPRQLKVEQSVDFHRYLGLWYEIARKPINIERRSSKNITFEYTNFAKGKFNIDIHYLSKEGRLGQLYSEAKLLNAPQNNRFAVKYLPSIFANLKKQHYDFIRLDPDYQIALVGNRQRTHLWLLSRTPTLDHRMIDDYLAYAKAQGFKLDDLIMVEHEQVSQ
jgi:apolipoprotein D and lipocalin family protein